MEHDLVLSRAFVELFSKSKVAQQLAFRGGTALGKFVFEEPARYSEDIDLVQLEAGPITDTLRAIHGCLDGLDSEFDPPRTQVGNGRSFR